MRLQFGTGVMQRVLERNISISTALNDSYFTVPENVTMRTCHYGKVEYFRAGTEQRQDCNSKPLTATPFQSLHCCKIRSKSKT